MIETVSETPENIDKQLSNARAKLQAFEDGVDRPRLLKRLKLASPAHPVLLFRGMFLLLTVSMLGGALAVLVVPYVSGDWARRIAKFDAVVPVPPGVPGLPALLGVLALCMFVGWLMTTMAALAMGRDAQMLPWEQQQHQKLVNEVTRLTTQKAVMERMRSTPAGARPRINTPVPVSLRERAGMNTPPGLSRSGSVLGGSGAPPVLRGMQPGRFGVDTPPPAHDASRNPFGRAPGAAAGATPGGGGLFGRAPTAGLGTPNPSVDRAEAEPAGGANPFAAGFSAPAQSGGVLARARSGNLKVTPAGAAGRLTPNLNRDDGAQHQSALSRSPVAAPRAEQSSDSKPPLASTKSDIFGTPPALARSGSSGVGAGGSAGPSGGLLARARSGVASEVPDIVDNAPAYSGGGAAVKSTQDQDDDLERTDGFRRKPIIPKWGSIDDPWLEDAIEKAEQLAIDLPLQARLEFSQETHLPFTLVITRASPAIAIRSMVSYVDFLAGLPTPPRARIELTSNTGIDRSFHRNVEAALEPAFGAAFQVELEPGQVEIIFTRPDPAWQDHPVLPME